MNHLITSGNTRFYAMITLNEYKMAKINSKLLNEMKRSFFLQLFFLTKWHFSAEWNRPRNVFSTIPEMPKSCLNSSSNE